jgi:hypothetical protein
MNDVADLRTPQVSAPHKKYRPLPQATTATDWRAPTGGGGGFTFPGTHGEGSRHRFARLKTKVISLGYE